MNARAQVKIIIALLLFSGLGVAAYKMIAMGYPLIPKEKIKVWTVEAHLNFQAQGGATKVSLAVPGHQTSLLVLRERGTSSGYGFSPPPPLTGSQLHRRATWSRAEAQGSQDVYYTLEVTQAQTDFDLNDLQTNLLPVPDWLTEEPYATASKSVIENVRELSSDHLSFAQQLSKRMGSNDPSQEMELLMEGRTTELKKAQLFHDLLRQAEVEAFMIRGLILDESQKRQPLVSRVVVRDQKAWMGFEPGSSQKMNEKNFLAFQRGGQSLVDLEGGRNARVSFSILRDRRPALETHEEIARVKKNPWVNFSIYALPIDQQNSFRILLMVPLGALVVVIMRNLVGLKTSGTFMPILIGMAFLQTQLVQGFVIFALIVSFGLIVRAYLSRLDLLLVPRISAVVIVVIGIMAMASIVGHQLELSFARSVTLFPTIILAWTVERLSILWEEDGGREVAIQTSGSLIVAVLAYFVMGSPTLQYITFTFPELLLVALAAILMLGQYTGYRLSELRRFEPMAVAAKGES